MGYNLTVCSLAEPSFRNDLNLACGCTVATSIIDIFKNYFGRVHNIEMRVHAQMYVFVHTRLSKYNTLDIISELAYYRHKNGSGS